MSFVATAPLVPDFRAIAEAIAPRPVRFDPFRLVSGYRAYLIYTALAAKSDVELAEFGLERTDLPQIAVRVVRSASED